MPLVEGESLRDLLRREGRLPYDEVVRILLELAAGLQAAHQAGVVHRDVKPENILLEGSAREVLIMDFGIARSRDPDEPRLTMNGSVLGTPDYMSPEQAAGDPNPGPATDIYAFGIVGFEMITGRLPFEAGTVSGMLVKQVVAVAPRAEWFRPDCPVALADIIARCLAKHPDDRWASVADVAEALQRMPAGTTGWLTRLLARWVPLIRWGTERRSIVARFRRLALLFLVTNLTLFIIDLRDGLLDFAPPLLLVLGLFLSLQYGDLRHAGFTWRDLVGRRAAGRGDGRGTAGNGERGTGDGKDM
jgi:serine/threonine-protein kinase